MVLEFRVYGVAQPKGSTRAFVPKGWRRPVVTTDNGALKGWQQLVAAGASTALHRLPPPDRLRLEAGVRLTVACYLPRPQALKAKARPHLTAPDLDKLVRAVGDALAGVVYRNDAQIVDLVALKRYTAPGGLPYLDVRVEPTAGLAALGVVPVEYVVEAR
jgi:Holliday junction resolvase RusA-like endonuclease